MAYRKTTPERHREDKINTIQDHHCKVRFPFKLEDAHRFTTEATEVKARKTTSHYLFGAIKANWGCRCKTILNRNTPAFKKSLNSLVFTFSATGGTSMTFLYRYKKSWRWRWMVGCTKQSGLALILSPVNSQLYFLWTMINCIFTEKLLLPSLYLTKKDTSSAKCSYGSICIIYTNLGI